MKLFIALAAVLLPTSAAHAVILNYKLTGAATYAFRIDDQRMPDRYVTNAEVDFYDVPGRFGSISLADVSFYAAATGGGLALTDFVGGTGIFVDATGAQLYSGPESSPRLVRGEYDLIGFGNSPFHLSITAVPEPRSWLFFISGFAVAGWSARRVATQRRNQRFAFGSR